MGKVYLVGAGPGDPGLITVRGLACLRQAEVLVYDRLVSDRLVREAPESAELVYVGKQAGHHTLRQSEINALLVDRARSGRTVVRLKGGDPFVFGRGGEEAAELAAEDIPFEIVPGVTSGVAAPAYAGIPVTHRGMASAVTFVTGHEDPGKPESDLDWDALAGMRGTLVFFMGVGNLPKIVHALTARGRDPSTPAAAIAQGTVPGQHTATGTLESLARKVEEARIEPPALIVVGDVVELRDQLAWFERRPLFGRRIVVTRTRTQASTLVTKLEELGAETIEMPTIRIEDPDHWGPVDRALDELDRFDWVAFTSVNGVERFLRRLFESGRDVRALGRIRLCAIGPSTADALGRYRLRADLTPERYVAESLVDAFRDRGDLAGARFLLPRGDLARSVLPEGLRELGAEVIEVTMYRTVAPESGEQPFADCGLESSIEDEIGRIDAVTFASSSAVRNFVQMLGQDRARSVLGDAAVMSIGPVTSDRARMLGLRVAAEAKVHTIPGLVKAMVSYFERMRNVSC